MSKNANWLRHTAMSYVPALLEALVTSGDIKRVTIDPTGIEVSNDESWLWVRADADKEYSLEGIPVPDITRTCSLMIRICTSTSKKVIGTMSPILKLEELLAKTQDTILSGISSGGFASQDPPIQIESCGVVEDPALEKERDYAAATIELVIKPHC